MSGNTSCWVRRSDKTYGPYKIRGVIHAFKQGKFTANDTFSLAEEGPWEDLKSVVGRLKNQQRSGSIPAAEKRPSEPSAVAGPTGVYRAGNWLLVNRSAHEWPQVCMLTKSHEALTEKRFKKRLYSKSKLRGSKWTVGEVISWIPKLLTSVIGLFVPGFNAVWDILSEVYEHLGNAWAYFADSRLVISAPVDMKAFKSRRWRRFFAFFGLMLLGIAAVPAGFVFLAVVLAPLVGFSETQYAPGVNPWGNFISQLQNISLSVGVILPAAILMMLSFRFLSHNDLRVVCHEGEWVWLDGALLKCPHGRDFLSSLPPSPVPVPVRRWLYPSVTPVFSYPA